MADKNRVEVIIGGKSYTLMGTESDEYMQKVALYINKKMNEIMRNNSKLSTSMASVLTAINVADDFFKAYDSAMEASRDLELAREEIERLKEENERLANENSSLMQKNTGLQMELVRKETENNEIRNSYNKQPRPRPSYSKHQSISNQ